jgi:hypothetical protein
MVDLSIVFAMFTRGYPKFSKKKSLQGSPLPVLRKSTRCRLWLMPLSRAWRLKAEANSGMPGYLPGKLGVFPWVNYQKWWGFTIKKGWDL